MTRARLATAIWACFGLSVVRCNPVYILGTENIAASDGGDAGFDGGDAGDGGSDGGDAGFDGGDGGLDGGDGGGGNSCSDVSACACGDFCGSSTFDGGACTGSSNESCLNMADCLDEGPGPLCLVPVDSDAGCGRQRCYPKATGKPQPCASDLDCSCLSGCAQPPDGGAAQCYPLSLAICTTGTQCDSGICLNVFRDGGVCGGICYTPDH
jgi:hypothetical protein